MTLRDIFDFYPEIFAAFEEIPDACRIKYYHLKSDCDEVVVNTSNGEELLLGGVLFDSRKECDQFVKKLYSVSGNKNACLPVIFTDDSLGYPVQVAFNANRDTGNFTLMIRKI